MTQKIHLIFKTHLDVCFTDYAAVVLNNYYKNYIPAALRVAREMRESDRPERFIWTTGSFLIYEYLEQGNPAERKQMEDAILAGEIAWHALPFTTHTELMDTDLFRFGLSLSAELDQRFRKHTIAAKMTDVPGHTRGIIPLLAEAGVQFLHIGVNPGSTVPGVPPLFRWQDPQGAEIIVMYESGYGSTFTIEGIEDSLAFGHTGDNLGPQSTGQVLDVYADVRKKFPTAEVFASTLDNFAARLSLIRTSLPVVNQEIGDTWIHGVGSDPIKVSRFKELSSLRAAWLQQQPALSREKRFKTFSRRLLMIPEHTWGTDEKTYLGDHENYSAEDFTAAREKPNFQKFQSSWVEKRAYPQEAVNALEDLPQAAEALQHLQAIRPQELDLSTWKPLKDPEELKRSAGLGLRFEAETGALISLQSETNRQDWAADDHPLAWLRYQTFSAEDYERFFNQYIIPVERKSGWAREDFTKPGLELAGPVSRFWQPRVNERFYRQNNGDLSFLFHLAAEPESAQTYGCPRDFWLQYRCNSNRPSIEVELQWFHKKACRMPEAIWLTFLPQLTGKEDWRIEKMGQEISPQEVVPFGNRHLHASGKYVLWRNESTSLKIRSLDAPLVAPGKPSLLDFNNDQPQLTDGMHFNLLNNLWGTNFPMWFEEDCRFRFEISLAPTTFRK
jgi:hypothetical protein